MVQECKQNKHNQGKHTHIYEGKVGVASHPFPPPLPDQALQQHSYYIQYGTSQ